MLAFATGVGAGTGGAVDVFECGSMNVFTVGVKSSLS